MSGLSKKLCDILIYLGILREPVDLVIRRTYAGAWQLSRGAWKWWAEIVSTPIQEVCGSVDTLADIVSAHSDKNPTMFVSYFVGYGGTELFAESFPVENSTFMVYCGESGRTVDAQINWLKENWRGNELADYTNWCRRRRRGERLLINNKQEAGDAG